MQNSKLKINPQLNHGFTLIELLITVALIGIVGTITTQIFILGFRSLAKSEAIKEVKQSGDYALSVMESMVRNASNISNISLSCNTSTDELSLINPDGFTTTFTCLEGSEIASASGFTTYPLTSTKVIVSGCNAAFRVVCPTPPLYPKYVLFNFTVSQAAITGQPTPQPENRASLEYQSTVSLRNYQ